MASDENDFVGFTAGAFDLLHAGHVLMLKECSEVCDYLIVGLHVDPSTERPIYKSKPVQSVLERYIQLDGCGYVDQIIPYESESDLLVLLRSLPIDVRILGEEYKDKEYTGKGLVETYYNPRTHPYSSSDLRIRIKQS